MPKGYRDSWRSRKCKEDWWIQEPFVRAGVDEVLEHIGSAEVISNPQNDFPI